MQHNTQDPEMLQPPSPPPPLPSPPPPPPPKDKEKKYCDEHKLLKNFIKNTKLYTREQKLPLPLPLSLSLSLSLSFSLSLSNRHYLNDTKSSPSTFPYTGTGTE